MKSYSIIIPGGYKSFDVFLPDIKRYDVRLNTQPTKGVAYLTTILDKKAFYGGDLVPIIMYLTESIVEMFLCVSLFDALMYPHDTDTLGEIDDRTLFSLENGGGYNQMVLSSNTAPLGVQAIFAPDGINMSIITQGDVALSEFVVLNQSVIALRTGASINNVSIVKPDGHTCALINVINDAVVNYVELLLRQKGIHWLDGTLGDYDDQLLCDIDRYDPATRLISNSISAIIEAIIGTETSGLQLTTTASASLAFSTTAVSSAMSLTATAVDIAPYYALYMLSSDMVLETETTEQAGLYVMILTKLRNLGGMDGTLGHYDGQYLYELDDTQGMRLSQTQVSISSEFETDAGEDEAHLTSNTFMVTPETLMEADDSSFVLTESTVATHTTSDFGGGYDGFCLQETETQVASIPAIAPVTSGMALTSGEPTPGTEVIVDVGNILDLIAGSVALDIRAGLSFFDNDLLYRWDDYLLAEMEAQTNN